MPAPIDEVKVRSPRVSLAVTLLGGVGGGAMGAVIVVVNWLSPAALVIGVTLLGLCVVTLFDVPHSSTFGAVGVTRHALLRRETIPWEKVDAIERATVRTSETRKRGGLVARCGRRRYLLTTRCESEHEFTLWKDFLATLENAPLVRASCPPSPRDRDKERSGGRRNAGRDK